MTKTNDKNKMNDVLKGNFKVKKEVINDELDDNKDSLEQKFEMEALKHLGGSIAFVSKSKVFWEEKENLSDKQNKKTKK